MPRSAANKAEMAAAALDAYLRDGLTPAALPIPTAQPALPESQAERDRKDCQTPSHCAPAVSHETDQPYATGAPLLLAHTDWLYHRFRVSGPVADLDMFRHAAAGAGTIPWQLDLDSAEEDWFHLLATSVHRDLSLTASRMLAGQLREAVERRHAVAVTRVGHSRACPFDLHTLVPVPSDILRLGPDHPNALAWLWQHWGTTQALRHVAPQPPDRDAAVMGAGAGLLRLSFWAADWTPWRALERIRAEWPALRFEVRPDYTVP